jgi:RNA polymerase sigma factor (sigma-70 family)
MPRALDVRAEQLLRELAPQVLGAVIRRFRDFAASEDAVQEAMIAASTQWPREGMPDNPRGWLIQVASRRMMDQVRSDLARRRRETIVVLPPSLDPRSSFGEAGSSSFEFATSLGATRAQTDATDPIEPDDTLVLFFMCCHPSLTSASAIALTLRAVGGLTTAEIAHAFLVPEATMAQRISRAKQTIKSSGVPFSLPTPEDRAPRLATVLHVLYLIFSEGYTTSAGPNLHRSELSGEAIRLTRAVHRLLPDDSEVAGLLALMLLTDARRAARSGPGGELIPLAKQDRSRWDQAAIAEGVALISATLAKGSVGSYQLQAAIAAIHDEAPRVEDTDWPQILALYGLLERMADNPMVTLNHAIAVAMVHGPAAGLEQLARLDTDDRIAGHHRLDAVRAHLLELSGNYRAAIEHYRMAASRTASLPERDYLMTQAARLSEQQPGS